MKRPLARQTRCSRQGIAAVEFAVCMPLLFVLVFGSIQACNLLFLKQALTTAAYQGTLEAAKDEATRASVREKAIGILAVYGIKDATVGISPAAEFAAMTAGTEVTITVSAPVDANLSGPKIVTPTSSATSTGVTMR